MQIFLMYHDVYVNSYNESGFLKESTNQYKIKAQEFEKHVKAVAEYCRIDTNTVVRFTFDDGGKSFATIIAPILEKYGIKGIFFISTKYIGTESFVSFNQLTDLKNRGHIIGSHSDSHTNLASLMKEDIYEEWRKSIKKLCPFFENEIYASIPEGYLNKDVIDTAFQNKISVLFTSEPTLKIRKKGDMRIIGRYVVYEGMTADDVMNIISDWKRRQIVKLKWQLINCMKLVLGNKYDAFKSFIYKRVLRGNI